MVRKPKKKKDDSIFTLRDKHQRYYQTSMHRRWRLLVLAEHPCCTECLKYSRVEPSTVADHIESLTLAWDKRNWLSNGTGLCDVCHNKKSNQERYQYRKKEREKIINDRMNDLNDV